MQLHEFVGMQVLVLGYVDTKEHGADTLLFCFIGFH